MHVHVETAPVSSALARSLRRLRRFAGCDDPILLTGESGSGKTYYASWVHEHSCRSRGVFHRVNLAALDENLAASELFGHVEGAYTDARRIRHGAFVTAHHGTLFLDEIGKASIGIQQRLLDAIESRRIRHLGSDREIRVDVRLIFAANESLEALIAEGRMLPDLVARLGYLRVEIPPLRERRLEIPWLLRAFVRRHAGRFGWPQGAVPTLSDELVEALTNCDWRDNVRGLENLVIRLLADAEDAPSLTSSLLVEDLADFARGVGNREDRAAARAREVRDAVNRNGGNRAQAARDLGMSRSRLYDYLRMDDDARAAGP